MVSQLPDTKAAVVRPWIVHVAALLGAVIVPVLIVVFSNPWGQPTERDYLVMGLAMAFASGLAVGVLMTVSIASMLGRRYRRGFIYGVLTLVTIALIIPALSRQISILLTVA